MLETKRLKIRKMIQTDLDSLYKLLSNEQVMRFSVNGPYSREKTEQYLSDTLYYYNKSKLSMWAITEKNDDVLIGICGFMSLNGSNEQFEIAYRILPSFQGNGFATEAAIAVRDYALKCKVNHFVAFIEKENVSSIKVAEKIGMKFSKEETYKGIPAILYEYHIMD